MRNQDSESDCDKKKVPTPSCTSWDGQSISRSVHQRHQIKDIKKEVKKRWSPSKAKEKYIKLENELKL